MSTTDRFRLIARWLWALCILVALAGWLVWDRDPGRLSPVLTWVTIGAGIGEASNAAKRATYKAEAVDP